MPLLSLPAIFDTNLNTIPDTVPYLHTDTTGLIENPDLVVAVDTAVAHLAGAMGKPVWLVLTFAHHWPWLLKRTDTPWYPSMRIYRQKRKGDWAPVFEQIEKDLHALVEKNKQNKISCLFSYSYRIISSPSDNFIFFSKVF